MAEQNGSAATEAVQAPESKGKGKAAAEPENDVSMETGDDSSSEEELDDVCHTNHCSIVSKLTYL